MSTNVKCKGMVETKIAERGKPVNQEKKNLRSKDKNQQQTQPKYGVTSGNRTKATLVASGNDGQMFWAC